MARLWEVQMSYISLDSRIQDYGFALWCSRRFSWVQEDLSSSRSNARTKARAKVRLTTATGVYLLEEWPLETTMLSKLLSLTEIIFKIAASIWRLIPQTLSDLNISRLVWKAWSACLIVVTPFNRIASDVGSRGFGVLEMRNRFVSGEGKPICI